MSEQTASRVEVTHRQGLHARPAAEFVKRASSFDAEIYVEKDDLEVNGKSIMGVMMLAAEPGSVLRIRADGPDSREAVGALVDLVENDFYLDEPGEGEPAAGDGGRDDAVSVTPGGADEGA